MSVANNTCTQTCQTSLTTFPDVNLITSSSFTVQPLLPRQRADLIAFSRFWLVYLAADWQVVGFNTAGVGADFLCTRLSEGFVAFDFMFPPLPLLLENPTYFSARQEEIKEDFRCQFRVQTPTRIHDSSQNDIRRFQYIFWYLSTSDQTSTAIVCVVFSVAKHHMAAEWKELQLLLVSEVRWLFHRLLPSRKGLDRQEESKPRNWNDPYCPPSLLEAD